MANYIIIKEKSQYYHKLNIIGDLRKNRIPILVVPKTIEKTVHAFSSLDSTYTIHRSAPLLTLQRPTNLESYEIFKAKRKKGRFHNRALTGEYLIEQFGNGKVNNGGFKFLTLTSSYDSGDLSRDFDVFLKRLKRYINQDQVPYIKVPEFNKRKDLKHLHILIYCPFVDIEWIREQWNDIHGAYEVWIEGIYSQREMNKEINYMAKYLSKSIQGRFSYSRSWFSNLRRLPKLWHALVVFRFKYFVDQEWAWIYSVWQEFLCLLKAGKVGAGIGNLYDFMIVSTW